MSDNQDFEAWKQVNALYVNHFRLHLTPDAMRLGFGEFGIYRTAVVMSIQNALALRDLLNQYLPFQPAEQVKPADVPPAAEDLGFEQQPPITPDA